MKAPPPHTRVGSGAGVGAVAPHKQVIGLLRAGLQQDGSRQTHAVHVVHLRARAIEGPSSCMRANHRLPSLIPVLQAVARTRKHCALQ